MKKANAGLALAASFFLIGHIVFTLTYLCTGFRVELISNIFARTAYGLILFHILLSVLSYVIFHEKGRVGVAYPKERIRVILQRASGILILLLLHGHIFQMVKVINHVSMSSDDKVKFMVVNIMFFTVLFIHLAVSLSRPFLTFGWIIDRKAFQRLDALIRIFCGIIWLIVCIVVMAYILRYR